MLTGERLAESALAALAELGERECLPEACATAVIVSSLLSDIARELRGAVDAALVERIDGLVADIRASGARAQRRLSDAEMRAVPEIIGDDFALRSVVTLLRGDRFVIDARRPDVIKGDEDYGL